MATVADYKSMDLRKPMIEKYVDGSVYAMI